MEHHGHHLRHLSELSEKCVSVGLIKVTKKLQPDDPHSVGGIVDLSRMLVPRAELTFTD